MFESDGNSPGVWSQFRFSTRAGPFFENSPVPPVGHPKARLFAFYLPQFFPYPENDTWWGKGFTEWRSVSTALPRFAGHIQPFLPRDLGYYDLRNLQTIQAQVELAQKAGVAGFAFYFYFPNNQRLMRQPLDLFCEHIRFPFQLIFANTDFLRNWYGGSGEVLLAYRHDYESTVKLIDELAVYLKHPMYERIGGRPILSIYHAGSIPEGARSIALWRRLFRERHQLDPILLMCQTFDWVDPRPLELDGAVEFPPHNYFQHLPPVTPHLSVFDPEFSGSYYSYSDLVQMSLDRPKPSFPLIKTVVPNWDNEARQQGKGRGLVGSTPALYQSWLIRVIEDAVENPFMGSSPMVFINAWNEWGEGAALEPSLHHGYAYANATARAVTSPSNHVLTARPRELWIVLGMHRSGTSLLARSLQVLGASLGEHLPQPNFSNPSGFWEDTDFIQINREISGALGLKWNSPGGIGPGEITRLWNSGFADRALSLIRSRVDQYGLFALKEPSLTQLLPFWQTLFSQLEFPVRLVVAYRHPSAVASSLHQLYRFSHIHGYLLWCHYNLRILYFLQDQPSPVPVISFDQMIADPVAQLERMATSFQASIHEQERDSFCLEFLDPDLQLHPTPTGVIPDHIPHLVQEIHLVYTRLIANTGSLPSHKQLSDWQQQLDQLVSFFSETWESWQEERAKLQRANQQTSHELQELQRQHQALLQSRSWQLTRPMRLAGNLLRVLRRRKGQPG